MCARPAAWADQRAARISTTRQQRAKSAKKAVGVEGDQDLCVRSSGERGAIYRKTNL